MDRERRIEDRLARARLFDYKSAVGSGTFLQLMLGVAGLTLTWVIVVGVPYVRGLRIFDNGGQSLDELVVIENRFLAALGVNQLVLLVCGVVWLAWFYRSYANLEPLGHDRRRGRWQALWMWLIPIMSFFRPWQLVAEVYAKSDPEIGAVPKDKAAPWWLNTWGILWVVYLISNVRTVWYAETMDETAAVWQWELIGFTAQLITVPVAILLVRSLTHRQAELAQKMDAMIRQRQPREPGGENG